MGKNKPGCRCGGVLRGIVTPKECPLFGKACPMPTHAVGFMVSVEGVCAAWYKYGQEIFIWQMNALRWRARRRWQRWSAAHAGDGILPEFANPYTQ